MKGPESWEGPRDPEVRRAIADLHRIDRRWNGLALVYAAVWGACAWVLAGEPTWPVRLGAMAIIGVVLNVLTVLVHESAHGNLFRHPRLDRVCGFLLGAPALLSATAYKTLHGHHHRYLRTEKDPDEFTRLSRRPAVLSTAFYAWALVGTVVYLFHVPLTALLRGNRRQRRAVAAEYLFMAALYGAVLLAAREFGRLPLVIEAWVAPMAVTVLINNVRGWAEHALTRKGHPLTQTRTVTSNRVVSFLMCNVNYHLEHHLYPGVPWYHLPKVHALLRPELERAGAPVRRSYLRFLWDAARAGVHGSA